MKIKDIEAVNPLFAELRDGRAFAYGRLDTMLISWACANARYTADARAVLARAIELKEAYVRELRTPRFGRDGCQLCDPAAEYHEREANSWRDILRDASHDAHRVQVHALEHGLIKPGEVDD